LSADRPRPTQAVILAGGRGSRLAPITDTIPKAMVPFHGKPFLEWILDMLREQGFEKVLLLLGYKAEVITEHFGDGSKVGLQVEYATTDPDDLTASRVRRADDKLDETFLLLYCDNYWPMRFDDMWQTYVASGRPAQITVYTNRDGYTRDSVIVEDDGRVAVFDRKRETPNLSGVEISYAILDRATVLDLLPPREAFPEGDVLFEEAVYTPLAERGQLNAYVSGHRYYSVGGHERLPLTDAFFARTPTVIVDRDGTLNERPPRAQYVTRPEDFVWLPGALEALRTLRETGHRVIVVSNQAGINRGALTEADLEAIHASMRRDVEAAGGWIDAIYHCPHDWDEGCDCRKPRPGMLYQAQRDFHLDLTRTLFIGDDDRDGQAAQAAGSPFEQVTDDRSLLDVVKAMTAGQLTSTH
jgi:D-glycero-D-manno-heptose 1,7-bisphosphate phosphatase